MCGVVELRRSDKRRHLRAPAPEGLAQDEACGECRAHWPHTGGAMPYESVIPSTLSLNGDSPDDPESAEGDGLGPLAKASIPENGLAHLSDPTGGVTAGGGGLHRGESFRTSLKSRASADSTLTSDQDNKRRVLKHLEKYYHETHFTRQTSDDQHKQTAQRCILPRNFIVPRSSVKRSLQIMDQRDTPDCPGEVKLGELLKAVDRFNRAFGEKKHPNWDVELMEELGINTTSSTFDPDWSLSWNRSPIYSRFCVQLGQLERLYFILDMGDNSSRISTLVSGFLFTAVVVSLSCFIFGTVEGIRMLPCAGMEINQCVPAEPPWMAMAEEICVWIFTLEIVLRIISAPQARRELLNHRYIISIIANEELPFSPPMTACGRFVSFTFSFEAICDILSVAPFWAELLLKVLLANQSGEVQNFNLLRILKVTRVFRIFKLTRALNADLGQFNEINDLLKKVMTNAFPAILMTILLIFMALFFFGTFVWFLERGEWVPKGDPRYEDLVTGDRGSETGAFIRVSNDGLTEELSPFDSVPGAFWWTLVTISTVGYGDQVPNSHLGKVVGGVAMLYGTVILGLPLFVVGATFGQEYDRLMKAAKRRTNLQNQGRKATVTHAEKLGQFAKATGNFISAYTNLSETLEELGTVLKIPQRIRTNWQESVQSALVELQPVPAMDMLCTRVVLYLSEIEEMWNSTRTSDPEASQESVIMIHACRRLRSEWYRLNITSCQLGMVPTEVLSKVLSEFLSNDREGAARDSKGNATPREVEKVVAPGRNPLEAWHDPKRVLATGGH
eukprot:s1336_g3.t2